MPIYLETAKRLANLDFSPSNCAEFLESYDPGKVTTLLSEILQDDAMLAGVASNSYVHQLGFKKFIIAQEEESELWLRLHYWPCAFEGNDEDIHDHCAPFVSRVLTGGLQHRFYEEQSGNDFSKFEYCFDNKTQLGASVFKGSTSLTLTGTSMTSAGRTYLMEDHQLHQVCTAIAGTVTISIWGPRKKNARVIRSSNLSCRTEARRSGISAAKARNDIQNIISKLHK